MLTRQEMDALVGKTLIIWDFPHICLAAGDDALLLFTAFGLAACAMKSGQIFTGR